MGRSVRLKRIEIAQDVLAQIRLKKYKSTPGTYVELANVPEGIISEDNGTWNYAIINRDISVQDLFKKEPVKCEVCALGACFMSLVNLDNEVDLNNFEVVIGDSHTKKNLSVDSEFMRERLMKYFPVHMMGLIESAFEGRIMADEELDPRYIRFLNAYHEEPYHFYKPAIQWGKQYDDSTDRLKAIMMNIIRNKGFFIVPQKFVQKYGQKPAEMVPNWMMNRLS